MILHFALFSAFICLTSSVQGEDGGDIVGLVPPQPDSSAQDYWTGKRPLVPKGKLLDILVKGSSDSERVERDVSAQDQHTVDHDHKDHQHDHQHDHNHQHDHSGDAKKREKRGYCSRCGGQLGGGYGGGGYGGGYGGGCGNNCGGGRPIYQQPIYQRPIYQQPSYGGGGGICSVCGQPYGGGGYGGGGSFSSSQSSSSSSSGSYGK